jgi:predicted dehydrogenase
LIVDFRLEAIEIRQSLFQSKIDNQKSKIKMPLRWGIIGCGDIARKRVARAILEDPGSQLEAACRRDEARLRDFCRQFDVPRGYADADELLRDPDIDAVYIATPVRLHLPQTQSAAAAGKHVLVEKPMARTVAECERMIVACRQAGVKLGVAYYRRFYPIVTRIRELIEEEALGRILAVAAVTSTSVNADAEDNWRMILEEGGGGALMDIGSHRLDLFLDLFGPIEEVQARCDSAHGSATVASAEDRATLFLQFASGVHGTLQCLFGTTANRDELTVTGTRGWLRAEPLNGDRLLIVRDNVLQEESLPPAANLHAPLIADFVEAVAAGREPRVSGEEGRRTNELLERAYRAAGRVPVTSSEEK